MSQALELFHQLLLQFKAAVVRRHADAHDFTPSAA
jgi:hypothetical protein